MDNDLKLAFARTFAGDDGQKVLAYLERFCRMELECFSTDINVTNYHLGRRSVILEIKNSIKQSEEN